MEGYLETVSSQTQRGAATCFYALAWSARVDSFHAAFLWDDSRHDTQASAAHTLREIIKQFFLTPWTSSFIIAIHYVSLLESPNPQTELRGQGFIV